MMGIRAMGMLVMCLVASWMGTRALVVGVGQQQQEYSKTYRSEGFTLGPGDVIDKYYSRMEMPEGYVAIRGLDAQLVEEDGTPVPLSETYLHHWVMIRYYILKDTSGLDVRSRGIPVPNDGVCDLALSQWFGLGSETRITNTTVPPPYGIPSGKPDDVPFGYEDVWILNIHAIDTRGTVNPRGCAECLCELYNVTVDGSGSELPEDYEGGLRCCYDETHCAVKAGFQGPKRKLYMEYTVRWVPMDEHVVPVRVYILDVTDSKAAITDRSQCKVEYTVQPCAEGDRECIHTSEASAFLPNGGDVVYGVAHQHIGGIGSTLYHQDGTEVCTSNPIYGNGLEAGNETGYIVGMTTCYPKPGTASIKANERLRLKSWYNNEVRHTGVMGLFYLLVADTQATPLHGQEHNDVAGKLALSVLIIGAGVLVVQLGFIVVRMAKKGRSEYEPIV